MSDEKTLNIEPDLSQEELLHIIKVFLTSEEFTDTNQAKARNKQDNIEVAALRHAIEVT